MAPQAFNLISDPWIQVIEKKTGAVATVSMGDLFAHAQDYARLAGDMAAQDLAVMRLLLAVLHTVYSRVDANGQPYDWLDLDDSWHVTGFDEDDDAWSDELLDTWQALHERGGFTAAVGEYLDRHRERFDFFGDTPFYQVTADQYDALVPKAKQIASGKGIVGLKQINRLISESGNSKSIFTPRSGDAINRLSIPELIRWVITYQNFTGVTDKSKITTTENFPAPTGWLYQLSPVFALGDTLAETLLLNLVLTNANGYHIEKSVWEWNSLDEYVNERTRLVVPDNVSALYTAWTRILHIQWLEDGEPRIFSASIPMYPVDNAFIEPMTTWHRSDKERIETYRPDRRGPFNRSSAMWRKFGQYVQTSTDTANHEPGVVTWLGMLQEHRLLPRNRHITLMTVALVFDGNMSSQLPDGEVRDDMSLEMDVLFDATNDNFWPKRIEDTVTKTLRVSGEYRNFLKNVASLRGMNPKTFPPKYEDEFYSRLNAPFKEWLAGLSRTDDRDEKISEWYRSLDKLVLTAADEFVQRATPRDISGIVTKVGVKNIFTVRNDLAAAVRRELKLKKGES